MFTLHANPVKTLVGPEMSAKASLSQFEFGPYLSQYHYKGATAWLLYNGIVHAAAPL